MSIKQSLKKHCCNVIPDFSKKLPARILLHVLHCLHHQLWSSETSSLDLSFIATLHLGLYFIITTFSYWRMYLLQSWLEANKRFCLQKTVSVGVLPNIYNQANIQ